MKRNEKKVDIDSLLKKEDAEYFERKGNFRLANTLKRILDEANK